MSGFAATTGHSVGSGSFSSKLCFRGVGKLWFGSWRFSRQICLRGVGSELVRLCLGSWLLCFWVLCIRRGLGSWLRIPNNGTAELPTNNQRLEILPPLFHTFIASGTGAATALWLGLLLHCNRLKICRPQVPNPEFRPLTSRLSRINCKGMGLLVPYA